jgi:hypothetical protein
VINTLTGIHQFSIVFLFYIFLQDEVDRLDLNNNKWRMRKIEERTNGMGRKKKWRLGTKADEEKKKKKR